MPTTDFQRQNFQQAIRFFREKVNLPTERWDDIAGEEHDTAFVVAGAAKASLLADLRQAVNGAVAEGKTRREFAQEFDQILERQGWKPNGGKEWRANVIYQTNVRTAYAAGRWEQLTDPAMLKARPYWQWVHGDSVHPRVEHLALNGKIFPADSVFWREMYPPQGFGCKCKVKSLAQRDVERDDLTVEDPPEVGDWITTEDRAGTPQYVKIEPAPGFGVAAGASRPEQRAGILRELGQRLPPALWGEFQKERELMAYDQPIDRPADAVLQITELLDLEDLTPEQRAEVLERAGDNPTRGKLTALILEVLG